MIHQKCAICEKDSYTVLYKANFDIGKLDEKTFSARRLPDRVHFQIVRCKTCGLLYSTPVLEYEKLENLYKKSFVDYDEHIDNLKKTYGYYLKQLETYGVKKETLLEIGCGNGFFLEEALSQGYKEVYGVEPGRKSAEKAPSHIKKNIAVEMFKSGLFKKNFFDVVCCFQTLDHLPDPNSVLKECFSLLKKGGYVLFLNHDAGSFGARLLGERSPIIDIEHTYLYDKKTMRMIFEKHGFTVSHVENSFNIHHLGYWVRLFPLPNSLKIFLIKILRFFRLDRIKIKIYPGNIVLVGKK